MTNLYLYSYFYLSITVLRRKKFHKYLCINNYYSFNVLAVSAIFQIHIYFEYLKSQFERKKKLEMGFLLKTYPLTHTHIHIHAPHTYNITLCIYASISTPEKSFVSEAQCLPSNFLFLSQQAYFYLSYFSLL